MNAPLRVSALQSGLPDPVLDSQRVFRAVLDATAHPGRAVRVPVTPPDQADLAPAVAAYCLALFDFDTPLWMQRVEGGLADYLRFHCGCPLVAEPGRARFALITDPAGMPPLSAYAAGEAEYPDRSATVLIQLSSLEGGEAVSLSGPGIHGHAVFAPAGLPPGFWRQAAENHALYPCGVDLVFACDDRLTALPRSTRVEA